MSRYSRLMLAGLCGGLIGPGIARAGDVLINQIFADSSAAAPFNRDFVELKNRGDVPVTIAGWALHHATPTGTVWSRTFLPAGTLAPGQHLLVAMGPTSSGGTPLPANDVLWAAINLNPVGGRLALTHDNLPIGSVCPLTLSVLEDLVGYGSATCAQTLPAPAITGPVALRRVSNGCVDTHSNVDDFALGQPTPRNKAAPANPCTPPTATLTVRFSGVGVGQVVSVPAGAACTDDCELTFATGTTVWLEPIPGDLTRFDGWVGAGEGFASRAVQLLSSREVTARFVCLADITSVGGPPEGPDDQLTVDDIIAFINAFSDGCLTEDLPCNPADVTSVGGPPLLPDGQLTVDDIIAFINGFAEQCPN